MAAICWLDELDLTVVRQGWATATAGRTLDGNGLRLRGQRFERGIMLHAHAELLLRLDGRALRFKAVVGIDDEVGNQGSAQLDLIADGTSVYTTDILRGNGAVAKIDFCVEGVRELILVARDGGDGIDGDHLTLGDARLEVLGPAGEIKTAALPIAEPRYARVDPDRAAIGGPRVVGCTAGRPFLYRVPATGRGRKRYTISGLPAGLGFDASTGIIEGRVRESARLTIGVECGSGRAEAELLIDARGELALTPPMGWNSWNCWGLDVTAERVEASARAMIDTGLADAGYSHINIDDGWSAERDRAGRIGTNEKFPDMRGLVDRIHGLGLRAGTYSSPGPKTCGGFPGTWQHEEEDARSWAEWGFDYVKYDYCTYGEVKGNDSQQDAIAAYRRLREALDRTGRDIVYSICTAGVFRPWEWANEVRGNLWRTTNDIVDTWGSAAGIGFSQDALAPHAGPGHWNDPDMLVAGRLGWGGNTRPTRLTLIETQTHLSLWAILAAPMLLGCDLTQLDEPTLALLTNPGMIAVNQDILGMQGRRVYARGYGEIWARPLVDGWAVGFFNRGPLPVELRVSLRALGLATVKTIEDVWTAERWPAADDVSLRVPPHGSVLWRGRRGA